MMHVLKFCLPWILTDDRLSPDTANHAAKSQIPRIGYDGIRKPGERREMSKGKRGMKEARSQG